MKRKVLRYNPRLKERARSLRQHMTRAEVFLWQHLKARQMEGYDFDRQRPIDEYIVDFFSKDLMLAIEVDGVTHDSATGQQHDRRRQQRLETLGVRFLRFQDEEVRRNLEGVLTVIRAWIREKNPPRPAATPPRRGAAHIPSREGKRKRILQQPGDTGYVSSLCRFSGGVGMTDGGARTHPGPAPSSGPPLRGGDRKNSPLCAASAAGWVFPAGRVGADDLTGSEGMLGAALQKLTNTCTLLTNTCTLLTDTCTLLTDTCTYTLKGFTHVLKGFGLLDHQGGTGLPTRITLSHLPNAPGNNAELRHIVAEGGPFKCRHILSLVRVC